VPFNPERLPLRGLDAISRRDFIQIENSITIQRRRQPFDGDGAAITGFVADEPRPEIA
jgi:hypothetical protein